MKKVLFIIVLLSIGIASMFVGANFRKESRFLTQSSIPSSNATSSIGVPQTLRIPKLQLETHVESVGMDAQTRMDLPKDADNVAWYNLGNKPGTPGNAVIAGHFDKEDGGPAVFWRLKELTIGDKIIVLDDQGKEYIFIVIQKAEYPYDNFPLQKVFGSSSEPMLNLITCQGTWNSKTKVYSHRMVVYTKRIE